VQTIRRPQSQWSRVSAHLHLHNLAILRILAKSRRHNLDILQHTDTSCSCVPRDGHLFLAQPDVNTVVELLRASSTEIPRHASQIVVLERQKFLKLEYIGSFWDSQAHAAACCYRFVAVVLKGVAVNRACQFLLKQPDVLFLALWFWRCSWLSCSQLILLPAQSMQRIDLCLRLACCCILEQQ
jgi:hypothetical protein